MNTYYHSCDQRNRQFKNWTALVLFSAALCLFSIHASAADVAPSAVITQFVGKQIKTEKKVFLEWTCSSQTDNSQFNLHRSKDRINWIPVAQMRGAGTSTDSKSYQFIDEELDYKVWFYKLEWVDAAGTSASRTIEVTVRNPNSLRTKSVELGGFKGKAYPDHAIVLLKWSTFREFDNAFFSIYRSLDRANWSKIGTQQGSGTMNETKEYTFYDSEASLGTLFYKLEWTESNGEKGDKTIEITNGDLASMKNLSKTSRTQVSTFIASPSENGTSMKIHWMADIDKNLREFLVLHSLDKTTWSIINVSQANTNDREIMINHAQPDNGVNFYKLMWFDQDDAFSFATVNAGLDKPTAFYQPFPNPAFDKVTIQSNKELNFATTVTIFNTRGGEYTVPAFHVKGQMELDISSVPSGIYIVKLDDGFVRFQKD